MIDRKTAAQRHDGLSFGYGKCQGCKRVGFLFLLDGKGVCYECLDKNTEEKQEVKKESETITSTKFNADDALIAAHWGYIERLLVMHEESPAVIEKIGFHYRTAFLHGIKHAREERWER